MNKTNKYLILCIMALNFSFACQNRPKETAELKEGKWSAEFRTETSHRIPFLFEVTDNQVTLINGTERVLLDSVIYRGDSIFIPIKAYDTELRGILAGDSLAGSFHRLFSERDKGVPFTAVYGDHPRFTIEGTSPDLLDGRWEVQFITDTVTNNYVGVFKQEGSQLAGSILTNSGDFRFLEGVIDRNGFRLSAFAGLSPYLIQGKFTDKDHFEGEYVTTHGVQAIKGTRNNQAALANPYSLTQLKKGYKTLGFKLKDLKGNEVSLSDPKYKGKVVVVSILGSWCPNCLDETTFLAPWYKENKDRGVELIGLAFERKDDPDYIRKVLTNLIRKYDITYDILVGGKIADTGKVLPEIDKLKSFPTTFFIDKKGEVKKIHTGFNGPATGLFYDEFKADFNKTVDELLKQ